MGDQADYEIERGMTEPSDTLEDEADTWEARRLLHNDSNESPIERMFRRNPAAGTWWPCRTCDDARDCAMWGCTDGDDDD